MPVHVHGHGEQLFYVLDGRGEMTVGEAAGEQVHALRPTNFVRTPRGVRHSVRCVGDETLVYLSIDVFSVAHPDEPTWDSHVRAMCAEHDWDFDQVKQGPITTG